MPNRVGSSIYGMGVTGFGLVALIRRGDVAPVLPLPAWLPLRPALAMVAGVALVALGGAIIGGVRVRRAALVLAVMISAWLLAMHWPRVVMHPKDGGAWVVLWEVVCLAVFAWMIALAERRPLSSGLAAIALRVALGLAFVAFGVSHFVYHGYVESVIPAWMPARSFLAYATGVAHIAAGLSLLARVQHRLAAMMLSVMFGLWVVMLHIPRALGSASNSNEWVSLLVALCMCGGALVARGYLGERSRTSS